MISPGTPAWSNATAWDGPRDRFVVVGEPSAVFALGFASTPAWSAARTFGSAPPAGAAMVHDAVHQRFVAFSGNVVWTLPLAGPSVWTSAPTSGAPPAGQFIAAYDPVRDRVLTFGGALGSGLSDRMMALTLNGAPTWTVIGSGGPAARYAAAMAYDAARDRMIVFGGRASSSAAAREDAAGRTAAPALIGTFFNDTWAFGLATNAWTPLTPPGTLPSARSSAAVVVDATRDRLVLYGGAGSDNLVWSLPLSGNQAWSSVAALPNPGLRYGHTLTADASDGALLFGGGDVDKAWRLDLAHDTWSAVAASAPFVTGRSEAAGVFDPALRVLTIACGSYGVNALGDTWQLDVDGSPLWTRLSTGPGARMGPSGVFDPSNGSMLLFGGWSGSSSLADTWTLVTGGGQWWPVPSDASPSARSGHVAVFDPLTREMIVFGGTNGSTQLGDAYRRGTDNVWSPIVTSGTPPSPRMNACGIFDPVRRRLVMFGGNTNAPWPNLSNEVWALTLDGTPTWSLLTTTAGPTPREQAGAAYDAAGDRLIVFGGVSTTNLNDVWALPLSGPATWQPIAFTGAAPSPRSSSVVTIDPERHELLVFGGSDFADTWALPIDATVAVEPAQPLSVQLGAAFPNPSRAEVRWTLELPVSRRVTADIVDLAGRRITRIIDGDLEPGRHALAWDGRAGNGRGAANGVYFLRVDVDGTTMVRRIARID